MSLFTFVVVVIIVLALSWHRVPEGFVGVYYRGGALLDTITESGFHIKLPFLTRHENVQVTMQTDRVENIECGTSGGVTITFGAIEVVNRLQRNKVLNVIRQYGVHYDRVWIFDRIHHLINQFCSTHTLTEVYITQFSSLDEKLTEELQSECDKWGTGIEILAARVTKPRVPESIMKGYEQLEVEKANVRTSVVRQQLLEKQAETEQIKAQIEARTVSDVSRIMSQKALLQKQTLQKIEAIEDAAHIDRQAKNAEAEFYSQKRRAEANLIRLTPAYMSQKFHTILAQTSKVYFGKSVPELFSNDADLKSHLFQNISFSE